MRPAPPPLRLLDAARAQHLLVPALVFLGHCVLSARIADAAPASAQRRDLQAADTSTGGNSGASAECRSVCGGAANTCLGYSIGGLCIVQCVDECDCSRWSGDTCDCNDHACDDVNTGLPSSEPTTSNGSPRPGCAGTMPVMDKSECDADCVGLYFIDHMGGLCTGCMEDGTPITSANADAVTFGRGHRQTTLSATSCHAADACDSWCQCCECVNHQGHSIDYCEKQGHDCRCVLGREGFRECPDLDERARQVTQACCSDARGHNTCADGLPSTCDGACAEEVLPFFNDCGYLLGEDGAQFGPTISLCEAQAHDAGEQFDGSHIISPSLGHTLDEWIFRDDEHSWELCYSSYTDDASSPATFHEQCDAYGKTLTVALVAGSGDIVGGYASGSWGFTTCCGGSHNICHGTQALSYCVDRQDGDRSFIFGVPPDGGAPVRHFVTGADERYLYAGDITYWPTFGSIEHPDLSLGHGGPPGVNGVCDPGGVYSPGALCSSQRWDEGFVGLEVWVIETDVLLEPILPPPPPPQGSAINGPGTCNDGYKGVEEDGVDCGGKCPTACPEPCPMAVCHPPIARPQPPPPPPPERTTPPPGTAVRFPGTCQDGLKGTLEDGIDCGGKCPSPCPVPCPPVICDPVPCREIAEHPEIQCNGDNHR